MLNTTIQRNSQTWSVISSGEVTRVYTYDENNKTGKPVKYVGGDFVSHHRISNKLMFGIDLEKEKSKV